MDRDASVGTTRLTFTSAAWSFPGEEVSGDAWTVEGNGRRSRLTLIDGLGHGPEAAEAATVASKILTEDPELEPAAALTVCHHALTHTRGAAMLTLKIDLDSLSLTYAGVGNIEGRLCLPGQEHRLVSFRGIVGRRMGTVRTFKLDLRDEWVLIVHTDGVSSRFETPPLNDSRQALADRILEEWGRATDDATVVVAAPQAS